MFIAQRLRSWSIILCDQLCLKAHDGVQIINEWAPLEMNDVSGLAVVSSYRWSSELQGRVCRNLRWKDPPPSAWCHCRAAYPLSHKQTDRQEHRIRNRAAEGITHHVMNGRSSNAAHIGLTLQTLVMQKSARLISGRKFTSIFLCLLQYLEWGGSQTRWWENRPPEWPAERWRSPSSSSEEHSCPPGPSQTHTHTNTSVLIGIIKVSFEIICTWW